jgi:hypothetical protein
MSERLCHTTGVLPKVISTVGQEKKGLKIFVPQTITDGLESAADVRHFSFGGGRYLTLGMNSNHVVRKTIQGEVIRIRKTPDGFTPQETVENGLPIPLTIRDGHTGRMVHQNGYDRTFVPKNQKRNDRLQQKRKKDKEGTKPKEKEDPSQAPRDRRVRMAIQQIRQKDRGGKRHRHNQNVFISNIKKYAR